MMKTLNMKSLKKMKCALWHGKFPAVALALVLLIISSAAIANEAGPLTGVEDKKFVLRAKYEKAVAEFTVLDGDILKVEITAPEIFSSFPSLLTVEDGPQPVWFKSDAAAGKMFAGGLLVEFSTETFALTVKDNSGYKVLELPAHGLQWASDGSYSISFHKETSDHYFGLGEPLPSQIGASVSYDNKKIVRPIWNRHLPPADMGIPFFYNPRGYGLFVDNPWKAEFDFTTAGVFTYRAAGGPLKFYVIPAKDAFTALDRYTALTGRPPIPPRWATGYMQSKFGYQNEKDFRWLMDNFRSRKLPCDTLIFDLDWFPRMGDLWWNSANYPNGAAKFQNEMAERGFKSITIVEPYMFMDSVNFKEAHNHHLLTRVATGGPHTFPFWGGSLAGLMDFTNPDTQKWFGGKIARIHESGVDAWWTDLDEPENDFDETNFLLGTRAAAHNLEAFLMNKSIFDEYSIKFPDERPFIMSRSGFAGIQRFGTSVWSGDVTASFQHLANQIPIGLSTSLSGIPMWNSDTGGFHNKPSTELYVRWFQFSAFCPVFRSHGNHTEREPFSFGDDAEKICRNTLDLRYRMAPYLYSLYRRMNTSGAPIMTPMFMEFPQDAESLMQIGQYMYGPWLLVAPVVEQGAEKKKVHLPPGEWTYFSDERTLAGPRDIAVPVTLDTIPLFVREGALLPLGPVMQYVGEKPTDPLTVHYYPSASETSFELYEDDGLSRAYERGEYAVTTLRGSSAPGAQMSVSVEGPKGKYAGMPAKRAYEIVFHHCPKPAGVYMDAAGVQAGNTAYDEKAKILTVKVPNSPGTFTLTVKY